MKRLATIVKANKFFYTVYFYLFGLLINILRLFVKTDEKLILINSFGGKKYDDSPKAIFEAMIDDARFDDYKIIWAFHNPKDFEIPRAQKIKTDTLTYYTTALKAKCWITNSGIERGLSFKGKNVFYFNTWHGTPIKKMGSDISDKNQSFRTKTKKNPVDIMTAQSDFEADIFSRVFNIQRDNFLMCGLPRNDILANYTSKQRAEIREKLGIPVEKKVILYAPTFREFERDSMQNCVLKPPIDLAKWKKELGAEYVLLFRAHYEVAKALEIQDNSFVREMSSYSSLNDLMIASDMLISDYSSIFFDYSIMEKPMIHFTYDYAEYEKKRGMYFDIREFLDGSNNEDGIIELLKTSIGTEKTIAFKGKFVGFSGNATNTVLDCIAENLLNEVKR